MFLKKYIRTVRHTNINKDTTNIYAATSSLINHTPAYHNWLF